MIAENPAVPEVLVAKHKKPGLSTQTKVMAEAGWEKRRVGSTLP